MLQKLYILERGNDVKMSELTEEAVAPKPIERQKVSTCLKVFSERTYHAILNHSGLGVDKIDTAIFIPKVIRWWKILNVKNKSLSNIKNDPLRAEISDPNDHRLLIIQKFGNMILKMAGPQGKRVKQLTKDTAVAVWNTCYGLVDLCKHLLSSTHQYVLLGKFSTDGLEKDFSKFRQGSGGTYFISVQQVIEKLHIKMTSVLLSLEVDISQFTVAAGHLCDSCGYQLCQDGAEVFDNLPLLENSIPIETKKSLVCLYCWICYAQEYIR